MVTTTSSMAFVVHGSFITEHARAQIFESGWEEARRFLGDAIVGLPADAIEDILRGRRRLDGDSTAGCTLEDEPLEDEQRWGARIQHHYTKQGLYRQGTGKFWQPYATVINFGSRDYMWALETYGKVRGNPHQRALCYADSPLKDHAEVCVVVGEEPTVLFRQVAAPPSFVCPHGSWQEAVSVASASGYLESRGPESEYGREAEPEWPRPSASGLDDLVARAAIQFGVDPAALKGMAATVEGQKPSARPAAAGQFGDSHFDNGYIAPGGQLYGCNYGAHEALAEILLGIPIPKLDEERPRCFAIEKAIGAGYMKIRRSASGGGYSIEIKKTEEKAQLESFAAWCSARNLEPERLLGCTSH